MDRAKGIHAGLWQRSDQAPVFYVIAMKDNKDEQVNYTHINNCFNQTISEFVFFQTRCYWCPATIPLNSTPSTSVTATERLQTVKPLVLSHTYCQVRAWDFSVVRASENWENWFLAKVPNSMPSLHRKVCFKCLNWLIILIFCSKQELSTLVPNPLLSSAQRTHHSWLSQKKVILSLVLLALSL